MIIISMNISCWDRSISCWERYRSISSIIKSDWTLLVGPSGLLNKKIFGHFNVSTSIFCPPVYSVVQLCILLRILFRILCFEVLQSWLDRINSIKVIDISVLILCEECERDGERERDSDLRRGEALHMMHPWAKYVSARPLASHQICVCQNYFNFPWEKLERPFVKPISTSQWPQPCECSWHFLC